MRISPEKLTEFLLKEECVITENKEALFIKQAFVCVFDGLILFQGDLNMAEAIPRLNAIAEGLGLPICVIERAAANMWNSKKFHSGKHIGPGNWLKNSWNSMEGFDFFTKDNCNTFGYLIKDKKEEENKSEIKKSIIHNHTNNNNTITTQMYNELLSMY